MVRLSILAPLMIGLIRVASVAALVGVLLAGGNLMAGEPFSVFLLRHAEKTAESVDPKLTPKGMARAQALKRLLKEAEIEAIHVTEYQRTKMTALPLADALGLSIQVYPANRFKDRVEAIKKRGGRHLFVGHSNTLLGLVKEFGGQPGDSIDYLTEFDRLYFLQSQSEGKVSTVVMRYGAP